MSKDNKRRRIDEDVSDTTSEGMIPPPSLMTSAEVNEQADIASQQIDLLLSSLANEKETARKKELKETISTVNRVIRKLVSGYLSEISLNSTMKYLLRVLEEKEKTAQPNKPDNSNPPSSYAGRLTLGLQQGNFTPRLDPARKVSFARGKSLAINRAQTIVIGPTEENKEKFNSSAKTKEAVMKCLDPVVACMKVNRMGYGPESSVVIEGNLIDAAAIAGSSELAQAGLMVKPDQKLSPRLIVHDIPVELDQEEIVHCLVKQNLPDETESRDVKVIYLYPATEKKKFRSCVIETTPEIRRLLRRSEKVYMKWWRCRINDHVSVLQCYKCCGFNHLAKACSIEKNACGYCAGEHKAEECKEKTKLKCINCVNEKLSNTTHAATDKFKCPILRKKIDRKMLMINYGEL